MFLIYTELYALFWPLLHVRCTDLLPGAMSVGLTLFWSVCTQSLPGWEEAGCTQSGHLVYLIINVLYLFMTVLFFIIYLV